MIKDEKTVRSLSRTGDRRELLKGPLTYGTELQRTRQKGAGASVDR